MKVILLTGATGFIGSRLLQKLLTEDFNTLYRVVVISSIPVEGCVSIISKNHIITRQAFLDAGVYKLDFVIHAGAFTPKNHATVNDFQSNTNILSTESLLQSIPLPIVKFIFLSTLDVYKITDSIITEKSEAAPSTLYGWSKLYCEKMIKFWCNEIGQKYQILRIGNIYGPGEEEYNKLIPYTIKSLLKGEIPTLINGGNQKRTFLYIDDCINAILASLRFESQSEPIINIASEKTYTIKEVVNIIINLFGKSITPLNISSGIETNDITFSNELMRLNLYIPKVELIKGLRNEINTFNIGK